MEDLPTNGHLDRLIEMLWERKGTDLHLRGGSPARFRIDAQLVALDDSVLTGAALRELVHAELPAHLLGKLESDQSVDFSFDWRNLARIRGNAFYEQGTLALALRLISKQIPSLDELAVPPAARAVAQLDRGLVLVTGPAGAGKSTTLAALVGEMNKTRAVHVLTLEDPVEYVHTSRRSLISQREIGVDASSFGQALRAAFREDPDVLLIGEMRDLESIQIALTMAETGHLVLATLHTNDATQAVDRIIDVFPSERQDQIRIQLSATIQAVIAQRLLSRAAGGGLVAAFEILIATPAVRNLIREGKANQLRNVETMSLKEGMCTFEDSLATLVRSRDISLESARAMSAYPAELDRILGSQGSLMGDR